MADNDIRKDKVMKFISIHFGLNYIIFFLELAIKKNGRDSEIRTRDLLTPSQTR